MTTSYWFVRHGPTHASGFCGHRDIPADLSDAGKISRLKAFLPHAAKIFSSDLSRTRETARAIYSGQTWLPESPQFREMDFGAWDGIDFEKVRASDPELFRLFWEEPGATAPPNGESWDQLATRINAALNQINADGPHGDIIVVCHFAVILAALQRASGMSASSIFSFKIDNFSVTNIDFLHKSNNWRINYVNQTI